MPDDQKPPSRKNINYLRPKPCKLETEIGREQCCFGGLPRRVQLHPAAPTYKQRVSNLHGDLDLLLAAQNPNRAICDLGMFPQVILGLRVQIASSLRFVVWPSNYIGRATSAIKPAWLVLRAGHGRSRTSFVPVAMHVFRIISMRYL